MLSELDLPPERDLPPVAERRQRATVTRYAAGKSRNVGVVRLALAVAIPGLLLAAPAVAFRAQVLDLFASADEARPAGEWALPARGQAPPPLVQQMAARSGIIKSTLRLVAATGAGRDRVALTVGVGRDGKLWVGRGGDSWAMPFVPISGRVAHAGSIVEYLRYGGPRADLTDQAQLVGFVRADVARLMVARSDGTEVAVPLNVSRGFAYAATAAGELPTAVRAYAPNGQLIEEKTVETAASP
jgi:hypothetical protein